MNNNGYELGKEHKKGSERTECRDPGPLLARHPLSCSCPSKCVDLKACQHYGGTLPVKLHKVYDRILTRKINLITEKDIVQVLRLNQSQFEALIVFARQKLDGYGKYIEGDLTSTKVEIIIYGTVQHLRNLSDRNQPCARDSRIWTAPLVEKEVYVEAALTALVVRCLYQYIEQKHTARTPTQIHTLLSPLREAESRIIPRYSRKNTISHITERPLDMHHGKTRHGLYKEHSNTALEIQEPVTTQTVHSGRTASKATQTSDTNEGETTAMQRSDNNVAYYAATHEVVFQDNFEALIAQKRDYDARLNTLNENLNKLRQSIDQKDSKIRELESQKLEHQLDIAELGAGLTSLKEIQHGNEDDLNLKLLQVGIPPNTINRLAENPNFQRQFTCRKRKRDSDTSTVEANKEC